MTRPPTDKPLAKAEAHLQAGRIAQAVGAFRAVLLIDPAEVQAHFGLAECALARDCTDEAIAGLVAAAAELGTGGLIEPALHLYAGALTIDPDRLELHVDVAELEIASGRPGWASARLHALARAYQAAGRCDDAAAIEEFSASLPSAPAPTDEACIVELPTSADPVGSTRRGARRGAPRWQPVGSPGRSTKAAAPPPPPPGRKLRPLARPVPVAARPSGKSAVPPPAPQPKTPSATRARVTPAPKPAVAADAKKKAPPAPSPLALRLRMREAAPAPIAAAKPTKRTSKPTSREDLKRRLASSLAAVKAKHGAGGSTKTLSPTPDTFEDERTVLFRRPA